MPGNPYSLIGKTVLVTGASSGIGRSVAIEASKLGAMLVITGRDSSRLQQTLENLHGSGHASILADLTQPEDLACLLDQLPMLDAVSHNAGIAQNMIFKYLKEDKLDELMNINFRSTVLLQKGILRKKLMRRGSSVVFMTSRGTYVPSVGNFTYAASKGALLSGARILAKELAPSGIRVNCVSPGMIQTDLLYGGILTDEQYQENAKLYPLGGYGAPEDVAWMVCFLISEAARWITGGDFNLDGGRSLA